MKYKYTKKQISESIKNLIEAEAPVSTKLILRDLFATKKKCKHLHKDHCERKNWVCMSCGFTPFKKKVCSHEFKSDDIGNICCMKCNQSFNEESIKNLKQTMKHVDKVAIIQPALDTNLIMVKVDEIVDWINNHDKKEKKKLKEALCGDDLTKLNKLLNE